MREFINIINEAASGKSANKIDRSAFIYLPPKGKKDQFAQCESCEKFIKDKNQCALFSASDKVKPEGSCGLYVHGTPSDKQKPMGIVSPKQAGYVEGPVRCQNCSWSDGNGKCNLYIKLNEELPDIFKLDENIEADACCNAWTKN